MQLQKDGSLKLDDTKFAAAVKNLPELTKALSNVDPSTPANNGFAKRFAAWTDNLLNTDGTLPGKAKSIQARIAANQKDQERMNDRLAQVEQRMRAQYSALDTAMAKANALSKYVTQQITTWNKRQGRVAARAEPGGGRRSGARVDPPRRRDTPLPTRASRRCNRDKDSSLRVDKKSKSQERMKCSARHHLGTRAHPPELPGRQRQHRDRGRNPAQAGEPAVRRGREQIAPAAAPSRAATSPTRAAPSRRRSASSRKACAPRST